MTYYLDTSLVVAFLTEEIRTADVSQWVANCDPEDLAISEWVATEVVSALSMKVRHGIFPVEQRNIVLTAWSTIRERSFRILSVESDDFKRAARYLENHKLGLRAGDALHIAISARHGCTLVTLDQVMGAAALECGVPLASV